MTEKMLLKSPKHIFRAFAFGKLPNSDEGSAYSEETMIRQNFEK